MSFVYHKIYHFEWKLDDEFPWDIETGADSIRFLDSSIGPVADSLNSNF